ncbi:MAG: hypothetical protein ACRC42_03295 [Mycoplasma sp.]
MTTDKIKKIKRWTTATLTTLLTAGSFASIGYSVYHQVENMKMSNDFDSGRSLQLELRITQTDEKGDPILDDVTNEPLSIYTPEKEKEYLKITTNSLIKKLQEKKLNNIRVSQGYGFVKNIQFPNHKEKIAILYADFEYSESAFELNDIKEEVNEIINNKKIFSSVSSTINYEIESVQGSYYTSDYNIPSLPTGRNDIGINGSGIFIDETTSTGYEKDLNLHHSKYSDEQIGIYSHDGLEGEYASIKTEEKFNAWTFALNKQIYDSLPTGDSGGDSEGESSFRNIDNELLQTILNNEYSNASWYNSSLLNDITQKNYQTPNTWLLWKDKQGLINYINSLISIWYYNVYANKIPTTISESLNHEQVDTLFKVDDEYGYWNYVDKDTRDKINVLIKDLSTDEKCFIAMVGQLSGATNSPNEWRPTYVTDEDLIPLIYSFQNSKRWNSNYVDPNEDINASISTKAGWGWLESGDSSLSWLLNDYLDSKIDYKNYTDYLFNEDDGDDVKETDTFTTNTFLIKEITESNKQEFVDKLNNDFKFEIINSNAKNLSENIIQLKEEMKILGTNVPTDKESDEWKEWSKKVKEFAILNFSGSSIYGQQYETRSIYTGSWLTLNPLNLLMIIIGIIIFLVGIFISIRYRVPGLLAFAAAFTVLTAGGALFLAFGFSLSFYAVIALAIASFLCLLSPIFFFRNLEKELKEKSTMGGSVVKSIKKYWKMSLDVHIISILISLSFLFFGIGGNINFGAMLIISVFLSFLLSGIIFYILLLIYTQFNHITNQKFFLQKSAFINLMSEEVVKKSKFDLFFEPMISKVNLFGKWSNITVMVLSGLALIGVILLFTFGNVNSIDFNHSNILVIKNIQLFDISVADVNGILNLSVINSYIYNNELFIFTRSSMDIAEINTKLADLFKGDETLIELLNSNTFFTTLSTNVANDVALNTFICLLAGIGFSAVWALLSLNIVSILPLIASQLSIVFIVFGFISLVQIPMNLDIVPVILALFMLTSIISTSTLSSIKRSWDRTIEIKPNDLKTLVNSIVSKINVNFIYFGSFIMLFSWIGLGFSSADLIPSLLTLLFGSLFVLVFSNRILVNVWFQCIMLRDKFNKELSHSEKIKPLKVVYDDVDEQLISGINN